MVWRSFVASGAALQYIEGKMTAKDYIKILKENLPQSAGKLAILDSFRLTRVSIHMLIYFL